MRIMLVSVLCLCLAGCATPKRDAYTIAKRVLKKDYSVLILPEEDVASGNFDEDIRAVAAHFSEAKFRRKKLAITSSSPKATSWVVQKAVALNSSRDLSDLTVLYLGSRTYGNVTCSVLESVGATCYYREFRMEEDEGTSVQE